MPMYMLADWTAKRAGGRITIYHSTGKVVGVDTIRFFNGKIVATTHKGEQFELFNG